jgi:hypothetical protein
VSRPLGALVLALALAVLWPAAVEAQYFGRNRVQYRTFEFRIIRTEHFDVYYYDQERAAALDAARMIERSYGRLSRLLRHEFRERKPVILYASHAEFQQTNALGGHFIDESTGGVTEAFKQRIIMPFTGSHAEFDHVLTHELVHQFQYDVILRRGLGGDANPFAVRLPLWFMEGMAEYLSLGRVDPHTESWLRDAVLTGYLRTIAEMNVRDDYLSYRFGQSLWAFIGGRWGDEVVGMLLQRAPRMGLERAFTTTLGVTLDELSAEWMAAVRRTYLPQVADHARPDEFAERLTAHDRFEDPWFLAPAISPDGERMVFLSQRDGFSFDLWLADARTGRVEARLVEAARSADFESLRYMSSGAAFSPDGRLLAFVAQTGGGDALYLYDVARRRVVRQLRFDLNGLASQSWAPDGRRIVFTGLDGGFSDLFITDLDGRLQRLTEDRHAALLPAWSPDGRRIAFTTDRGPDTDFGVLRYGNYRVALYDLAARSVDVLDGQDEGKNMNPVWSPDGTRLIWVGDRTGTNNLYAYDLRTHALERLTDVLSGVVAVTALSPVLSWSRSGRLLFTYFEAAGYNVYGLDDPLALPRHPVGRGALVAQATASASPPRAVSESPAAAPGSPSASSGPGPAPGAAANVGITVPALPADSAARSRFLEGEASGENAASFYRSADGFRRSAERVAAVGESRPVSVAELLADAARVLPDTADFELARYRVRFSPDLVGRPTVGAQVGGHYGSGLYGGSYVALSDMLGDHNVLLAGNVNGSLSDANFFGSYTFLRTRTNFGVALAQQPLYRYLGGGYFELEVDGTVRDVAANVLLRDVVRSAQGVMTYPFSTFRRLELGASGVLYKRDVLYRGYYRESGAVLDIDRRVGDLAYAQPMAALVFDNTRFGWTGPVTGRRYRLQFARSYGDLSFDELLVDVRNYMSYRRDFVFATRLIGLARMGGNAEQFRNYWGGPYFLRGYDGSSFRQAGVECERSRHAGPAESISSCPARDQLIGASAALLNAELRVPVVKELHVGALGSFPPVDGVAFFDAGLAWDESVCSASDYLNPGGCEPHERRAVRVVAQRRPGEDPYLYRAPLLSYGVGLRINIFYAVLRLDYAFPLSRPDRESRGGVFSLAFGPSF